MMMVNLSMCACDLLSVFVCTASVRQPLMRLVMTMMLSVPRNSVSHGKHPEVSEFPVRIIYSFFAAGMGSDQNCLSFHGDSIIRCSTTDRVKDCLCSSYLVSSRHHKKQSLGVCCFSL